MTPGNPNMTDETHDRHESPTDGAPVWVRALQAAVVGIAAGLVLHMLLSLVVVQGKELWSRPAAPAACKKNNPAKETGTPAVPPELNLRSPYPRNNS
jgi:hypothetical protein